MKPQDIFQILDLAKTAREKKLVWNPLFQGDAGLGKSQIIQQWVKQEQEKDPSFGFIDLRLANREAPDLVGFPKVVSKGGKDRTDFMLPAFWPTEGKGVLLLEEPNRAHSSVLNAIMELLTDRKVQEYTLPDGWMIVAAINQDDGNYQVTQMDPALKDRFEIFDVQYDHASFVSFTEKKEWNPALRAYIKKMWTYKTPSDISDSGKYISPRTLSKVNTALECNLEKNHSLLYTVLVAELGKHVGGELYKFMVDQTPVTTEDILKDKEAAFTKLKMYCNPKDLRSDMINVTVDSLIKAYDKDKVNFDLVHEVMDIIPADQGGELIKKTCEQHIEKFDEEYSFEKWVTDNKKFASKFKKKCTGAGLKPKELTTEVVAETTK